MRPTRSWCLTSQYFCLDLLPVGVLRRGDLVADHLEHVRIRRQREHRHHQALDARRDDELVARVLEMVEEVAEEEVLAGLLQPDHRVQLGRGLVRAACARRKSTYADGTSMSTRKYARFAENRIARSTSSISSAST